MALESVHMEIYPGGLGSKCGSYAGVSIELKTVSGQCETKPYAAFSAGDTLGGFQLEFVNKSRVINHMTFYKSNALIVEITAFRLESKYCIGFLQ